MHKSKVQTLHALIRGVEGIVLLLLLRHGIPLPLPDLVPPDIKHLDRIKENNVEAVDGQQNLVASSVQRLVVVTVDVGRDDVAALHKHVVQGSADGSRPDGVAVLCVPADDDGVAVWITEQARQKSVSYPWGRICVKCHQSDEPGEDPDVGNGRDDCAFLETLRDPRYDDEVNCEEELGRDCQQIGLEDGKANVAENVRQICARWAGRDVDEEAEEVERPLLPVFEDF